MPPPVEEERLFGGRYVDAVLLSGVNGRGVSGANIATSEGATMCLTDCLTDTEGRFPPSKPRVSIWRECNPGLRPAHQAEYTIHQAGYRHIGPKILHIRPKLLHICRGSPMEDCQTVRQTVRHDVRAVAIASDRLSTKDGPCKSHGQTA